MTVWFWWIINVSDAGVSFKVSSEIHVISKLTDLCAFAWVALRSLRSWVVWRLEAEADSTYWFSGIDVCQLELFQLKVSVWMKLPSYLSQCGPCDVSPVGLRSLCCCCCLWGWKGSRLCLLGLRPADVSCLIVHKLNRSSSCGPAGAWTPYDFHVHPIILPDPDPLLTYDHSQFTVTLTVVPC